MQAAERLEAIAQRCRAYFPVSLTIAICQYASGAGALASVQHHLQKARRSVIDHPQCYLVLSNPAGGALDDMDLRLLDMCLLTDTVSSFFSAIAVAGPVEQACEYLRANGANEATILDAFLGCTHFYDQAGAPTALGRFLLASLPEQFPAILQRFQQGSWAAHYPLFKLLLLARSHQYLDLAWQLAQTGSGSSADIYAVELLKADPARFTPWARQIAHDAIQSTWLQSYQTLEALLELNPALHLDLALQAASAPLRQHSHAILQQLGLKAAYHVDPVKYRFLVERAAGSPHPELSHCARVLLSELIVADLGFDDDGQCVFEYGPRQFTVRLCFDQTLQLTDHAGKPLRTLPKPGARDNADQANAALTAWRELKKQVPQLLKQQDRQLEQLLIAQYAWRVERWHELFQQHPLLRCLAIRLVWGVFSAEGAAYQEMFRPLEDGSLTTADDAVCALPAEGLVRLIHPLELNEATRQAWIHHLTDYDVEPPFPQLTRPIARVSPDERAKFRWERAQESVPTGAALKRRAITAGWAGGQFDEGTSSIFWKTFRAAGVQAVLEIARPGGGNEQESTLALVSLAFVRLATAQSGNQMPDDLPQQDQHLLQLGDVLPLVFSEAVMAAQTFAAP